MAFGRDEPGTLVANDVMACGIQRRHDACDGRGIRGAARDQGDLRRLSWRSTGFERSIRPGNRKQGRRRTMRHRGIDLGEV